MGLQDGQTREEQTGMGQEKERPGEGGGMLEEGLRERASATGMAEEAQEMGPGCAKGRRDGGRGAYVHVGTYMCCTALYAVRQNGRDAPSSQRRGYMHSPDRQTGGEGQRRRGGAQLGQPKPTPRTPLPLLYRTLPTHSPSACLPTHLPALPASNPYYSSAGLPTHPPLTSALPA